jgi:hypothetical protein
MDHFKGRRPLQPFAFSRASGSPMKGFEDVRQGRQQAGKGSHKRDDVRKFKL